MIGKKASFSLAVMLLFAFLAESLLTEVVAQQEMVPKWTFEDGSFFNVVAISADGEYIGAGTNNTKRLYLFRGNLPLWNLTVGSVHSISMSSDGKCVAVGAGEVFYLFNREYPSSPLLTYTADYEASFVAISSDGKYAVMGMVANQSQQNGESKLYMFERGLSQPSWIKTLPGVLESLSMSSDGNYIVAGTSLPGVVYMFARGQDEPLWSYRFGERSGGVKISSDGEYVVATGGNQSGGYSRRIFLFHRQNSTPRYMKVIFEIPSWRSLLVSSNGSIFVVSQEAEGRLMLFDMNVRPYSSRSIREASLPTGSVFMSVSSDGRYIFVGTVGGVFVYEYLNNELALRRQYVNSSLVFSDVACSSDGRYLVAGGDSCIYFSEMESAVNLVAQFGPILVLMFVVVVAGVVFYFFYKNLREP